MGVGRAALCDGLRRRAGRLGDCGGASIIVVSEELLLLEEERDRDGVNVREAILSGSGWKRLLINSLVGLRSDTTVRTANVGCGGCGSSGSTVAPCCARFGRGRDGCFTFLSCAKL